MRQTLKFREHQKRDFGVKEMAAKDFDKDISEQTGTLNDVMF